jgi:hypothetical protein
MAYKYAQTGPPFDFTGHFSETQHQAFSTWVSNNAANLPSMQTQHQIRAQQLRKTAGLLEKYYATLNDDVLTPSFQKEAWQPGPNGHWAYAYRNDQIPAVLMTKVKTRFQMHLQRQDEGRFAMNHVRGMIEKQEDAAQYTFEAITKVPNWMSEIGSLFSKPEYEAVLVKDQSDQFQGQPRFRVNQLDQPTAWEIYQHNRSNSTSDPIYLNS